jgi:hypothetical protein
MSRVTAGSPIFKGAWNASALSATEHTIEVRAVSTTTVSDTIRVQVTSAVNRPPVAQNDSYSVETGKTLNVSGTGVLANDTDPDSDGLHVASFSQPASGTLTPIGDTGGFTYTPNPSFIGIDTFTYVASDGSASSDPATVSINVTAQADTVTIGTATWTRKTKRIYVEATSSAGSAPTLTVQKYGVMTYNQTLGRYTYEGPASSKPSTVTVTSSLGGSATKSVKTM